MMIYPAIELQNGRCVTLNRLRPEAAQVWHVDPVETARGFAEAGASWIQVTDFDAMDGDGRNAELVDEIIRAPGLPVQLAGGVRSAEQAAAWIERGVGRVVLGTMAVMDPEGVRALARRFPDQIVVAIDVHDGRVMAEGWQRQTALTPEALMAGFEAAPLAGFLITDIDSDVAQADAALGLISGLAAATRLPVIASGLVHGLDDVARLKYVRNVAGTVICRALFNRSFGLAEALEVAHSAPGPTAEFL